MCEFNLLDPSISSVPFNGDEIDTKHSTILKSENPDKHMEYFWVTFKDSIINYVGANDVRHIKNFSDRLNVLQKNKEYSIIFAEISKFMKTSINTICEHIIKSKDSSAICHLHTNITRWKNIDPEFSEVLEKNDIIKMLLLLSKLIKKKNDHYVVLNRMIIDSYLTSGTKEKGIKELFDFGVEHNICSLVEILLPSIDLRIYLGETAEKYKNMKSTKLIKEIKKQSA